MAKKHADGTTRGKLTDKKPAPTRALTLPSTLALQKLAADFTVELNPFPKGDECFAFRDGALRLCTTEQLIAFEGGRPLAITVSDQASHQQALELLKAGKTLKKGIEEHWIAPRRWLEARKKDISAIEEQDLALVSPGVSALNTAILAYEEADRRRRALEAEALRRQREEEAAEARRKELAALEEQRLKEEAASEALSQRERLVVYHVLKGETATRAAELAGYADPVKQGERLMASAKITAAVTAAQRAQALTEQAAALAEAPLDVAPQRGEEVQSRLGRVAGMRTTTTHTGEILDGKATLAQFVEYIRKEARGEDVSALFCPPEDLFIVDGTVLNGYARNLQKNIERWAGIRYNKKETKS